MQASKIIFVSSPKGAHTLALAVKIQSKLCLFARLLLSSRWIHKNRPDNRQ